MNEPKTQWGIGLITDRSGNEIENQAYIHTGPIPEDDVAECEATITGKDAKYYARLFVCTPDMLKELERLYKIHGYQSTLDILKRANG